MAAAGDVNGDGLPDVIAGAPGAGDGGTAYVYLANRPPLAVCRDVRVQAGSDCRASAPAIHMLCQQCS